MARAARVYHYTSAKVHGISGHQIAIQTRINFDSYQVNNLFLVSCIKDLVVIGTNIRKIHARIQFLQEDIVGVEVFILPWSGRVGGRLFKAFAFVRALPLEVDNVNLHLLLLLLLRHKLFGLQVRELGPTLSRGVPILAASDLTQAASLSIMLGVIMAMGRLALSFGFVLGAIGEHGSSRVGREHAAFFVDSGFGDFVELDGTGAIEHMSLGVSRYENIVGIAKAH